MDRDVLERLATDRALGGLTADVESLLDAYAKVDPTAAKVAADIDRTVRLAREALGEQHPSSMPAFPVAGFMQIERWHKRVQRFTFAAGMAACLTIGLGLGRLSAPGNPSSPAGPMAGREYASVTRPPVQPPTAARPVESGGFWSVDRLRQLRDEAQTSAVDTPERNGRIPWLNWNRPADSRS